MAAICDSCGWSGMSTAVAWGRCPQCRDFIRYEIKPLNLTPKLDVNEFNRRAIPALRGVTFAPQSSSVSIVASFERQFVTGVVSNKMQQAIYNIVHRYRRQITDSAVVDFAAMHAKGAD